jgi:DNA-binding MarR family transcriptional regulator
LTTTSAPDSTRAADTLRIAIGRCARRLRQHAGQELSPSRAAVLASVARHGPLTPSRLAELERTSRPTITRLVARLREQELVETAPDADDGRSYQISVTPAGKALRARRRQRKKAYLARLLEHAAPEEVELLERAANVLLRLLEEEQS